MLRRPPARESCDGEIKGMSEEMDRTRLVRVPPSELLERVVDSIESSPEALDTLRPVRARSTSSRKGEAIGNPNGFFTDLYIDPQASQRGVQLLVERDCKTLRQVECLVTAVMGATTSLCSTRSNVMSNAIRACAASRSLATYIDIEGRVPPVITRRRRRRLDFANDLSPIGGACPWWRTSLCREGPAAPSGR